MTSGLRLASVYSSGVTNIIVIIIGIGVTNIIVIRVTDIIVDIILISVVHGHQS